MSHDSALGTASDFAEFVWSLESPAVATHRWYREHPELPRPPADPAQEARRAASRRAGLLGHQEIEQYQLARINQWMQQDGRRPDQSWVLDFADKHDDSSGDPFQAPSLFMDGRPLRGRPDLVFRTASGDKVLIVERKITAFPLLLIPTLGWSNVTAQLWVYAWMKWWNRLDDANVLLVAEFWKRGETKRTPIWSRNDKHIHKLCRDWLSQYNRAYAGRKALQ